MKKTLTRLTALALCLCLLAGLAGAADYTQSILAGELTLSDGVTLQSGVLATGGRSDKAQTVRENVLLYTGEKAVKPIVAYGSTLYGRSSMKQTATYLDDNDLALVAGVNGAFFDMNSGIPYGLVVTDGVLRSSGNIQSVGFFEDGSAIIGEPGLKIVMETPDKAETEIFYNKALTRNNGIGLYSRDYDTATKGGVDGYHVILEPVRGSGTELLPNDEITLEVIGTLEGKASCGIPEDGFVLSIAEKTIYASALDEMQALEVGDRITITSSTDREWEDVQYACGGGDLLVENGRVCGDFTLDKADKPTARTAVGLKRDGTLVLYTADNGNGSEGLTLDELAARMKELECVTALNLDGGGSTALGAQYPGYDAAATVNKPSDGSLRPCANFIYLVRSKPTRAFGADKLFLYPYNAVVLPGTSIQLTAKAADKNYAAADVPDDVTYSSSSGDVDEDGVFTAGTRAGSVTVRVKGGGASGETTVRVIDEPTSLTLHKKGSDKTLDGTVLAGGSKTELSVDALYYGMAVSAQNSCYDWSVTGGIGKISENGVFTAAEAGKAVTGKIVVECGDVRAEAEVTVSPANPFADMKTHWAKDYVNTLYFTGVLTGSAGKDGKTYYRPDDSMTRQEFVVALMRLLEVDTDAYSGKTLPFDDRAKVASWAQNAVMAAYDLGYMGGSSSGGKLYANPTSPISRQEAMVILARTQDLKDNADTSALNAFPDRGKVASWAQSALAQMVQKGIITGSNGRLNPTGNVKRAEVAKMLYAISEQD